MRKLKQHIGTIRTSDKQFRGRDHLTVMLISGVTKAAVHKDRRKHSDKYSCRGRYQSLD